MKRKGTSIFSPVYSPSQLSYITVESFKGQDECEIDHQSVSDHPSNPADYSKLSHCDPSATNSNATDLPDIQYNESSQMTTPEDTKKIETETIISSLEQHIEPKQICVLYEVWA